MEADSVTVSLPGKSLSSLLSRCSFAMAQQDVRYFFNGMLFEIEDGKLRAVATNGQRLATSVVEASVSATGKRQFIIPRKGILELARMVPSSDDLVELHFSANHMQAFCKGATLTTKLIDGTYPDYTRAIPQGGDKVVVGSRQEIREALSRTSILSNEMYRNVRLMVSAGNLAIHANNPLQEEAEEAVAVEYDGGELEIGFNVGYLIDALNVIGGEKIRMQLSDAASAALVTDPDDGDSQFVVSPMML